MINKGFWTRCSICGVKIFCQLSGSKDEAELHKKIMQQSGTCYNCFYKKYGKNKIKRIKRKCVKKKWQTK